MVCKSLGFAWGVALRVSALGLFVGAFVGAFYGPIGMLILSIIDRLVDPARYAGGSLDAMVPALMVAGLIGGLMLGAFIGLLCGLPSGLVLGMLLRSEQPDNSVLRWPHSRVAAATGAVCSLTTLAQAALSDMPSRLTPRWPLVAWVVWALVPAALAFLAGWWVARREAESLEEQSSA